MSKLVTAIFLGLSVSGFCFGEDSNWTSSGEVSFESRIFKDDDKATTEDRGLSLFTRLEAVYKGEKLDLIFRGFGRVDRFDKGRDVFAPEDAHLKYSLGPANLIAGYQMFNWSATEVFHPADVLNSRNFDSNIENQEKIGELTLSARFDLFDGDLTFYYFPKYEKPIPPGRRSRLGIDIGFDVADPSFVEKNNFVSTDSYGNQYGVRLAQTLGDTDFTIHYLRFMDRLQPLYFFDGSVIRPHLFMMNQIGGTLSSVLTEGIIGKFEFAHKDFIADNPVTNILLTPTTRSPIDHTQLVWGLEWGWGNSNGTDTTLYAEYQYYKPDKSISSARRDELGIFQNDLFIGCRHAFNDVNGKELVVSLISDMNRSHEYLFQSTYSQRLNQFWKIKLGLRYIDAPIKNKPTPIGLEVLNQDHQFSLAFSRFF
jgi:hypothetical protein